MRRHLGRITFLWSPKGVVDRDILLFMILEIQRYMKAKVVEGPAVLWITPPLFESMSFISWMEARKAGLLLQVIPQHLYDSYRLTNRGVFDKLIPALDCEMLKRQVFLVCKVILGKVMFFKSSVNLFVQESTVACAP